MSSRVETRDVDASEQRATEMGVEVAFRVGDIQSLPFPDASFEVALSLFGLIFAPTRTVPSRRCSECWDPVAAP